MTKKDTSICEICGEKFDSGRIKSNHVRWKHKEKTYNISKEELAKCFEDSIIERHGEIKEFKINCIVCNTEFCITARENTYKENLNSPKYRKTCSEKCSKVPGGLTITTAETKDKMSESIKKYYSTYESDITKDHFICTEENYKQIEFNNLIKSVKKRCKNKKEFNLDIDYLYNVAIKQNFKCSITNHDLIFEKIGENSRTFNIKNASLDRIDSNLGYIKGNVRFVCLAANFGKSEFTDQDLIKLCKAIVNPQSNNIKYIEYSDVELNSIFSKIISNKTSSANRKGLDFCITPGYLTKIWKEAKGTCPYTGWQLNLRTVKELRNKKIKQPYQVSIDRKDPSKRIYRRKYTICSFDVKFSKE